MAHTNITNVNNNFSPFPLIEADEIIF